MPRRKLAEKNVRKLNRTGYKGISVSVTIPKELILELGWRERQKVVVRRRGDKLIIEDWKE